jgi:hypothetical protein
VIRWLTTGAKLASRTARVLGRGLERPATSRADGKLAGQMRLGAPREGGNLLVPDVYPLDLAMPANGISGAVQGIARNAVCALDACYCERSAN